jgi:hypothetical protein
MIDTERDSTANDISKIAKGEPCRNVPTTLVALRISCRDGTFNTPEKASANSTNN